MTGSEIIKIVATVAMAQCAVDLLARRMVFSREPYQRALAALERAQGKRDKLVATTALSGEGTKTATNATTTTTTKGGNHKQNTNNSQNSSKDKVAKRLQRAKDDCREAAADIAQRHTVPSFFGSLVFVILYRVLSTEYQGQVLAVLPFKPVKLLRRLTLRGLNMDDSPESLLLSSSLNHTHVHQACGFLFIYILCTISVKYFVHQLVGVHPPKGADGGLTSVMESPKSQRLLKSWGLDTDALQQS